MKFNPPSFNFDVKNQKEYISKIYLSVSFEIIVKKEDKKKFLCYNSNSPSPVQGAAEATLQARKGAEHLRHSCAAGLWGLKIFNKI